MELMKIGHTNVSETFTPGTSLLSARTILPLPFQQQHAGPNDSGLRVLRPLSTPIPLHLRLTAASVLHASSAPHRAHNISRPQQRTHTVL